MSSPVVQLSDERARVLKQTHLGRICGSSAVFRDRYVIHKALGRGGFGITFLAKDVSLPGHPFCVIKLLCPRTTEASSLQRAKLRFEQEAKTLSHLGSHAQIPTLLDYFEVNEEFYLVQEYVRGLTLSAEVKRNGPFSEMAVKSFLLEILPLMQYLHQNRVIHRDIKPPNIIRCRDDGRLVLIDFGAVKEHLIEASAHTQISQTMGTQFVGTIGFAPPEQIAARPIYSSDIYALGATCVYLLTGKPPFEMEVDARTGELDWRSEVRVSAHFGDVLTRMLRLSSRERYSSAQAVLRALNLEPYLDNLRSCLTTTRSQAPQPPLSRSDRPSSLPRQPTMPSVPLTARKSLAAQIRTSRQSRSNPDLAL